VRVRSGTAKSRNYRELPTGGKGGRKTAVQLEKDFVCTEGLRVGKDEDSGRVWDGFFP